MPVHFQPPGSQTTARTDETKGQRLEAGLAADRAERKQRQEQWEARHTALVSRMQAVYMAIGWFGSLGAATLILTPLLPSTVTLLLGGGLLLVSVVVGPSWFFLLEHTRQRLIGAARRDAVELRDAAPPPRLPSLWPWK